jgi:hypothetical protein
MLLRLSEMLMKPGPLQHGTAIFFLIFTFTDLVFMDLLGQRRCTAEAAVLPVVSTTSIVSEEIQENVAPRLAFLQNAAHNRPAYPVEHKPAGTLDEDCFCCCSHLIHGICVDIAVLNGSPQLGDPAILFIPSSPPRGTFHPPRLS